MAFDWLGTFNRSQFERLAQYAREQLVLIDARVSHLTYEQMRIGFLQFSYDTAGKPIAYSTGSSGSGPTYIGKLMAAYEAIGGDPFYDLQVRSMADPVYYMQGTETAAAKVMSNGEPIPAKGLADAPTANLLLQMRSWLGPSLDRRAQLERKIRRMLDYSDQLGAEVAELRIIQDSLETDGSLENIINAVSQMLSDPTYRATGEDNGADPFGKLSYAPYASYEPGGARNAPDGLVVERTNRGYAVSGEGGSTT